MFLNPDLQIKRVSLLAAARNVNPLVLHINGLAMSESWKSVSNILSGAKAGVLQHASKGSIQFGYLQIPLILNLNTELLSFTVQIEGCGSTTKYIHTCIPSDVD